MIFEAVNKSSFSACMKVLKKGGSYINTTEPLPSVEMLWTNLIRGKKLLLARNAPETSEALDFLKELVEMGKLKWSSIDTMSLMRSLKLINMSRKDIRGEMWSLMWNKTTDPNLELSFGSSFY